MRNQWRALIMTTWDWSCSVSKYFAWLKGILIAKKILNFGRFWFQPIILQLRNKGRLIENAFFIFTLTHKPWRSYEQGYINAEFSYVSCRDDPVHHGPIKHLNLTFKSTIKTIMSSSIKSWSFPAPRAEQSGLIGDLSYHIKSKLHSTKRPQVTSTYYYDGNY